MFKNLMRHNSPPLEGWRKFKRILVGVVFIVCYLLIYCCYVLTTPSSPVGRIHPSEGGEFLSRR